MNIINVLYNYLHISNLGKELLLVGFEVSQFFLFFLSLFQKELILGMVEMGLSALELTRVLY